MESMKLRLDTISAPATGKQATRVLRAVKSGKPISTPQGQAFIATLVAEMKAAPTGKPKRTARSAVYVTLTDDMA